MDNVWMSWGDVFNASLQGLWWSFIQFAPRLILAIAFFVIGWVLGSVVSKAFEEVFRALKIDNFFRSLGAENFFKKAGIDFNSGYFIGQVIKWFIIIVFLFPSLQLMGLDYVAMFLQNDILGFLPKVIVAAIILIIASILSDFLSKAVIAGSRAMNLKSAKLLGSIVKYSVWVFAFIMALGELGVAEGYMGMLFAGIIGMLALGGALAFGLGGRDAAARLISKLGEEISHRE